MTSFLAAGFLLDQFDCLPSKKVVVWAGAVRGGSLQASWPPQSQAYLHHNTETLFAFPALGVQ